MRRRMIAAGCLALHLLDANHARADDLGPEKGFILTFTAELAKEAAKEMAKGAGKKALDWVWDRWEKRPAEPATANAPAAQISPAAAVREARVALDFQLARDNSVIALDPSMATFHTGDRFAIRASANLPGTLQIRAVNAAGETTIQREWELVGGEPARIPTSGHVLFAAPAGLERLTVIFRPCRGNPGFSRPDLVIALPPCSIPPRATVDAGIERKNETIFLQSVVPAADRFGTTLSIRHLD